MKYIFIILCFVCSLAKATDPYPKNPAIDIIQYIFQLEVNDTTDVIAGKAAVLIHFKKFISDFELDLTNKDASGKGMEVADILLEGKRISYIHKNNRLKILLPSYVSADTDLTFHISYNGIPQDGLIIGNTKFGDRGFFGDNWPDRGHHWLPVVDHPSDKAAVDFIITAPIHYSVVANGIKIEESPLDDKRKLTHWHEEVPIPVKGMTAGIARFAVQYVGKVNDISVESWVYPQNRLEGFYDYAVAIKILDYFQANIGPYSYKKLANIQSKTRWGGLENANTIFYFENSVTGKGERESLIAHEEAHQWFGNSATENDWHHVWLSEGFATYFANLYLENTYGHDRLVAEQMIDREEVIKYHIKNPSPVVDTTIVDINKILNTNTYQKGGWVLHMLRHEIGDLNFWKGIRLYYKTFKNSNALTSDLQRIMEEVSGKDLTVFFNQWLYRAGHPKISGTWQYNGKGSVMLELSQTQKDGLFEFPLDIGVISKDGKKEVISVMVSDKSQKITIPTTLIPFSLELDPETWLLYEGVITQK
ncbi:MAG: M1 family metallopeptidase [Bacteroidia bacterium]|nr:M1 family metallopeptidase [Bacteroidia bacterium]